MTRTERQKQIALEWVNHDYIGTLIATTGMGKTRTSLECLDLVYDDISNFIIVVPTLELKKQWESQLHKYNNWEVIVINTAYKGKFSCDFLIIDEAHTVGSEEFKKVFKAIAYKKLLMLTATLKRADGGHELLLSKAPVIAEVTLKECLDNGWIAPYVVYNLPIPFTEKERAAYEKADKLFKYAAYELGSGGFDKAKELMKRGSPEEKKIAGAFFKSIRQRREIIINAENKILCTRALAIRYPERKTLVFNGTIDYCDKITKALGDVCSSYHGKIKKKEKEKIIERFKDPYDPLRILSSCKSLILGFDDPDISLGIINASYSTKLINIQTIGRIIRKNANKQAIIVNLYIPDTQEAKWLENKQEGQEVVDITHINQII